MSGTSFGEWVTGYPRSRVLRLVHRAPILLWRLGLGAVAGRAFVLVTTRGRKSGLPRRTVVSSHEMDGRIYSPCPYGERAEWYRNLAADPRVTIQARRCPQCAVAVRVTDDDELTGFYRLLERRDRAALHYLLDEAGVAHDPAEMVARKDRVHVIRFDPAGPSGLPPQRADLAWAWGLLPALLIARRTRGRGRAWAGLARATSVMTGRQRR